MHFLDSIAQNKAYIIAEMSANHAGSFERAKNIIHAATDAGADCIKIQTYTADTLTIDCDNKYLHIDNGTWKGDTLYNLYKKAYTPWEWQEELKKEADKIGIDFLSTPFDSTSVDFLESIGLEFYKIASFELVDIPLIKDVASKGKPIIMSTGMGTLGEIEEAVNTIKSQGNSQVYLLKCSSSYPAVSENMNLNTMVNMGQTFGVPVGLSDHSMGDIGAITAVAMGASIIEKHFCLSRKIENPDSSFSMEPDEFKKMVDNIRTVEMAKGTVKYGVCEEEKNSIIFRKSIFVIDNIKKGELFSERNVKIIRPGYGMEPKKISEILGKRALMDIKKGTPLNYHMIGE